MNNLIVDLALLNSQNYNLQKKNLNFFKSFLNFFKKKYIDPWGKNFRWILISLVNKLSEEDTFFRFCILIFSSIKKGFLKNKNFSRDKIFKILKTFCRIYPKDSSQFIEFAKYFRFLVKKNIFSKDFLKNIDNIMIIIEDFTNFLKSFEKDENADEIFFLCRKLLILKEKCRTKQIIYNYWKRKEVFSLIFAGKVNTETDFESNFILNEFKQLIAIENNIEELKEDTSNPKILLDLVYIHKNLYKDNFDFEIIKIAMSYIENENISNEIKMIFYDILKYSFDKYSIKNEVIRPFFLAYKEKFLEIKKNYKERKKIFKFLYKEYPEKRQLIQVHKKKFLFLILDNEELKKINEEFKKILKE